MTTTSTASAYQNYILYRTTAKVVQPASYTGPDGKTVTPPAVTAQKAGYVAGAQLLTGLTGITVPEGFAYALDADKSYPVGSIYTPPTTTETATTAATS